ncbi:MAG: hypothetical protein AB7J40_04760 [Candidatus Altimarinota bacterium]
MIFRTLFTSLLLSFLFAPSAFAQQIDFQLPDELEIDAEAMVTIEVTEGGEPMEVDDLSVTYSPQDGVFDDVVYDCADPAQMDNCRVNNRGVAGIFEAVFDLKKLPLTVLVDADGVQNSVQLKETQDAPVVEEAAVEPAPEVQVSAAVAQETQNAAPGGPVMAPESVQVGPSPSWWIILLPLALMCAVVSYFVVKTTD